MEGMLKLWKKRPPPKKKQNCQLLILLLIYFQGACIIRMMNFILGDETFKNGLKVSFNVFLPKSFVKNRV